MLPNLLQDKKKHVQIIGLYARAKQIKFENKEQISSFIRRNARAARDLVGYDFKRIIEVMHYLINNADFKWTIESCSKYIHEDLKALTEQSEAKYELSHSYVCKHGVTHQKGIQCGCTNTKEFKFD